MANTSAARLALRPARSAPPASTGPPAVGLAAQRAQPDQDPDGGQGNDQGHQLFAQHARA